MENVSIESHAELSIIITTCHRTTDCLFFFFAENMSICVYQSITKTIISLCVYPHTILPFYFEKLYVVCVTCAKYMVTSALEKLKTTEDSYPLGE